MSVVRHRSLAIPYLLAAAIAPVAQAQAAGCAGVGSGVLAIGNAARVEPGAARSFTIDLAAGQGVIVDLASLNPPAPKADNSEGEGGDGHAASPPPRDIALCNAKGAVVAPQPGEVFEKGSSVSTTPDGQRLHFTAPAAGRYTIAVVAANEPREILARSRNLGSGGGAVLAVSLDSEQTGTVSSSAMQVYSFAGTAGQWVEIKSKSESDTLLHLAGPDRTGTYSVISTNDDSDGLNPKIRRRLPVTGTYYVQVNSLADKADSFTLTLKRVAAPPALGRPAALCAGGTVEGKLAAEDDVRIYTLAVTAGHSYRLELTADYDGVVAIGLPNPVEPDDGADGPAAGFSEVKSQDSGTSGTEKLNFTARSTGQLLVEVKSFGIGETDGSYKLVVTDQGG